MTSPPRTLNSQAIEAGAVITAASAPFFFSSSASRWRLAADSSPAYSSGCGVTGATGCGGRASPQALSIGLGLTGCSSAPALAAAAFSRSSASGLCSRGS
jgi:hypothetical protein